MYLYVSDRLYRPEVAAFVMSYRALFGCEPNSFAFHGYDCLDYFAQCARFK